MSIPSNPCTNHEHIVIQDGVTSIEPHAFHGCTSLKSIVIPDSVTSICEHAFHGCISLKSIVIPNSVTSIGRSAFWGCRKLTNIIIPNGVSCIEIETFAYCEKLKNVVLPSGLRCIEGLDNRPRIGGLGAFYGCRSLQKIVIPSSVSYIGRHAFEGCNHLQVRLTYAPLAALDADMKRMVLADFLDDPSAYPDERKTEYISYMNRQKKTLLLQAIEKDEDELFSRYEQIGIKLPAALCDELIVQAAKESKTKVLAWLTAYKNRTVNLKKEAKRQERIEEQQVSNPYAAKCLRSNWMWSELEDGTIRIDKYKGKDADVLIPEFVDDKRVTTVGSYMFCKLLSNGKHGNNTTVKNIAVPEGVRSIEPAAFFGCQMLQTVKLPDTLNTIGAHALNPCCGNVSPVVIASNAVNELANASIAFSHKLKGKTFAVTGAVTMPNCPFLNGKPLTFNKPEFAKMIKCFGGELDSCVNEYVTCVVTHSTSAGSSLIAKAKRLGIPVLTLEEFVQRYFPEGLPL